jgi:hypothetical protein
MLLKITSSNPPATDLGFLLHMSPYRSQSFEMPFGHVHVYPERVARNSAFEVRGFCTEYSETRRPQQQRSALRDDSDYGVVFRLQQLAP